MTRARAPHRIVPLLAVVLALAACRGEGRSTRTGEPRRGSGTIHVRTAEWTLDGAGAERYGVSAPKPTPTDPLEGALLGALEEAGYAPDATLQRFVRGLVRAIPHKSALPPSLVDGLMWWAGLVDPQPTVLVVELEAERCPRGAAGEAGGGATCKDAIEALIAELRSSAPAGPTLIVAGTVAHLEDGRARFMVVHLQRSFRPEPIAVRADAGKTVAVRGALVGGRTKPRVEIIGPDGGSRDLVPKGAGQGGIAFDLACTARGIHKVEVLAEGPHGPEVVANFPIYCGTTPPAKVVYEIETVPAGVPALEIAERNFDLLNDERRRHGLPDLIWDPDAAAIAQAHSDDMAAAGFVGHVSPTTGDVTHRFARAKVEGAVIRENVARGYGPRGIHESLMNSPGHRVNLLASDVTHVGIGVAFAVVDSGDSGSQRPILLTQNFRRPIGYGLPSDVAATVRAEVDERRRNERQQALRWDPQLHAIAKTRAGDTGAKIDDAVFALGYQSLEQSIVTSSDWRGLSRIPAFAGPADGRSFGVGVAVVDGGRKIVMVVLIASK